MKKKMLSVDEDLHYELKVQALKERIELNELVAIALKDYLNKVK